jgi:hypothetical protein
MKWHCRGSSIPSTATLLHDVIMCISLVWWWQFLKTLFSLLYTEKLQFFSFVLSTLMSSHKKKTPIMWDNELLEFVWRGCKWGRACAPQKVDDYARKKQELIIQCEKNMSPKLSFTPKVHRATTKCTCGYYPNYGIVPCQTLPLVPCPATTVSTKANTTQQLWKSPPMT